MKQTKRFAALLLSVIMVFSFTVTSFSAGADSSSPSPVNNSIDTSVYTKTVLKNPKIKIGNAQKIISSVFAFADVDKQVPQLLKENVLNGQGVIDAIGMVVDEISNSLSDNSSLAPVAGIIKYLFSNDIMVNGLKKDAKFAGAVVKLNSATSKGFKTISDLKDSGITFTSEDFGFADGDAYGFIDALICSLSEILNQLGIRNILGDFTDSVSNGKYKVGNYNLFVPLYELLELDPMSSVEFTSKVNAAQAAGGSADFNRLREAANLTLKPVADLLTKVEKQSSKTITDILPKLLYALDSGMVNDLIHNLLDGKSLYGLVQFGSLIADVDINSGLIWDFVDKSFVTGTEEEPAGFDFDKDGKKETTLPLTKEQFDALIGKLTYAADASVKESVSSTEKNRLALETDANLVYQIICDFVIEFLETKDGGAFAKKALSGVDSGLVRSGGNMVVSMLQTQFGRTILRIFQDPIVSIVWLFAKIF